MDLNSIGIDVGVIIAIGAIAEVIKKADLENKLKRFYLLMPVVLSVLAAVGIALVSKNYSTIFIDTIKYFGISSFGYKFLKRTILNK